MIILTSCNYYSVWFFQIGLNFGIIFFSSYKVPIFEKTVWNITMFFIFLEKKRKEWSLCIKRICYRKTGRKNSILVYICVSIMIFFGKSIYSKKKKKQITPVCSRNRPPLLMHRKLLCEMLFTEKNNIHNILSQ